MKIKETNLNSTDKFSCSYYDGAGVYKNTDETGFVEYMFVMPKNSMVWTFTESVLNEFFEVIEVKESTELTPIIEEQKQNGLSEDFVLKMMAIVMNK